MNISELLNNLIKEIPEYRLTEKDRKMIEIERIDVYILNKLKSTKYVGSKMPKVLFDTVEKVVREAVKENQPIHVTVPFGGYKKAQYDSAPHIDWAEVFNVIQLRAYLTPIVQAYKPGIILDYFSDEIFVSRMNNISQEDLEIYNKEFIELVKVMNNYTKNNMIIKFSKIRDQITSEELHKRFDKAIVNLREGWEKLSKEERDYRINKSGRNYDGDLSNLSKEEKYDVLLNSTFVHDSFIFGDWREGVPWAFGDDMVPVGFRYTGDWGIHLKSSRSSTVQFWVGKGMLKKKDDKYIPTILTYNQYINANKEEVKVNTVLSKVSSRLCLIESV